MVFTWFSGRPDELTHSRTDRPENRMPPVPFFNGGGGIKMMQLVNIPGQCYGTVIMIGLVIARDHSVKLMNVQQHQVAADPRTRETDMSCESACRLLSSASTTIIY